MTRWHEDDLAGRLLDRDGEKWTVVSLPAIAKDNDPLGRKPGEWLWEGEYGYADLLRSKHETSDTRSWSALYQQEPAPDSGDYFRREWLIAERESPPRDQLRVYGASDYAVTKDGGDYTVHLVVGIDQDSHLHVLDIWRKQSDSAEWIEAWCDLVLKWKPLEWAEEGGQINASIGPFLARRAIERKAYTYRRQFPSRHDKSVRAQSVRARMSMAGLYLPSSATWKGDFESELLRFPTAVHDDQVDALGLIGQLLDHINAPIRPEQKPKLAPRKDWFTDDEADERNWKVA
jgi:predicted phage terminase large subunit-like protein